jgi:hypothetical protein
LARCLAFPPHRLVSVSRSQPHTAARQREAHSSFNICSMMKYH